MSMFLSRNLLILYLGTFIRFVYLRFIKRKDVLFKELLDLVKEGKIKKDDEMDIFTNEMANRSSQLWLISWPNHLLSFPSFPSIRG